MFRTKRTSAFTLAELLVAIAISTLLILALTTLAGSTLKVWTQETSLSDRRNAAMAVFGQIWRDLRFAEMPSDEPGTQFEMVINPPSTWIDPKFLLPQAAFWQAPTARDRSQGENAIVGYFVQWTGTPSTPQLCRLLINPSASADYHLASSPWVTTQLLNTYAPGTAHAPGTPPSADVGLIASNVLGLWMQPLDQNQNPIQTTAANTPFPASPSFDSRSGYISSNGRTYPNALPASMKVSIVVVDYHAAQQLSTTASSEKPTSSQQPLDFYNGLPTAVKQGARIYSTLISLINAPPS